MRKINKMDVLRLVLVLSLVAGAGLALGAVGRFTPTHKIVEAVNCISCHPEQAEELTATTHLTHFARAAGEAYEGIKGGGAKLTDAESITSGCTMCHNYWDNMKWFGVSNMNIRVVEADYPGTLYDCEPAVGTGSAASPQYRGCDENGNPVTTGIGNVDTPKDIYGNVISNYGMGSTTAWVLNFDEVEPWEPGLDEYEFTDAGPDGLVGTADDETWKRVDYLWSALSALSPGPVSFNLGGQPSCGTAEKGLCHIAEDAVALAAANKKGEFSQLEDFGPDGIKNTLDDPAVADLYNSHGAGVFFQHEMAYTTAQYSAKPVKLCGACHVFKLPPMVWGGENWASMDIKSASILVGGAAGGFEPVVPLFKDDGDGIATLGEGLYSDPFGFRPAYDLTGEYHGTSGKAGSALENFDVRYRTPDWAHMNVPCIRCHSHAGISGETVSSNK